MSYNVNTVIACCQLLPPIEETGFTVIVIYGFCHVGGLCMLMQMQYVLTLLKSNINLFIENETESKTDK